MSVINRIPGGLLDLLGIRSGGRTPQQLTEQLLPQLMMNELYFMDAMREVAVSVTTITVSTNSQYLDLLTAGPSLGSPVIVPSNEIWLIRRGSTSISWIMTMGAGTLVSMGLGHTRGAAHFCDWPMVPNGYSSSDAAITRDGAMSLIEDVWVKPGSRLQLHLMGATVAATEQIGVVGALGVVRMRL